jgi:hypothetical protein
MIKLVTLLKEIEAEKNLSKQDKEKLEQAKALLATLNELEEGTLTEDKITDVANKLKKLGLSIGLLTLLAGTNPTSAQTKAIDLAKAKTTIDYKAKANAILGTKNMDPSNPEDVKRVDTGYMKWTLGTSDDGVLGQYTSQFMFPGTWAWKGDNALAKQGIETNKTLSQISKLEPEQMKAWNKFVEWMKKTKITIPTEEDIKLKREPAPKPISGHSGLDSDPEIGQEVIDYYRSLPGNGDFFVKNWKEIKQVQQNIIAYRAQTVDDWKAGKDDPKGVHPGIVMSK